MYVCTHMYTYMYIQVCTHICVYTHAYMYVHYVEYFLWGQRLNGFGRNYK